MFKFLVLDFLKLDICAFTDFGCVTSNRSISLQPLENTIVEKVKRKKIEHRVIGNCNYFFTKNFINYKKKQLILLLEAL